MVLLTYVSTVGKQNPFCMSNLFFSIRGDTFSCCFYCFSYSFRRIPVRLLLCLCFVILHLLKWIVIMHILKCCYPRSCEFHIIQLFHYASSFSIYFYTYVFILLYEMLHLMRFIKFHYISVMFVLSQWTLHPSLYLISLCSCELHTTIPFISGILFQ